MSRLNAPDQEARQLEIRAHKRDDNPPTNSRQVEAVPRPRALPSTQCSTALSTIRFVFAAHLSHQLPHNPFRSLHLLNDLYFDHNRFDLPSFLTTFSTSTRLGSQSRLRPLGCLATDHDDLLESRNNTILSPEAIIPCKLRQDSSSSHGYTNLTRKISEEPNR